MIKAIIEELALPLNSLSVNRDFGPEILRNTFWKKILFIHGKILVTAKTRKASFRKLTKRSHSLWHKNKQTCIVFVTSRGKSHILARVDSKNVPAGKENLFPWNSHSTLAILGLAINKATFLLLNLRWGTLLWGKYSKKKLFSKWIHLQPAGLCGMRRFRKCRRSFSSSQTCHRCSH